LVNPVPPEPKVLVAFRGPRVIKVRRAPESPVAKALPGHRDRQAMMGPSAHQVLQASRAIVAIRVYLVHRAHRAQSVLKDRREIPALQARRVLLDWMVL
jgi:hypothetical protein